MLIQNKDAESFWLQKIKYPFSSGRLPWGRQGQRRTGPGVKVSRSLSEDTSLLINRICGDSGSATGILFIATLKVILYHYLHEENIYTTAFDERGASVFTSPVNEDETLRQLIRQVRDDFNRMAGFGRIDVEDLIERYRIRMGQSIGEEMYKFAFVYPGGQQPDPGSLYDLVCRCDSTAGNGYTLTMEYASEGRYGRDFLPLLLDNFIFVCDNLPQLWDLRIKDIDIRSAAERRIADVSTGARSQRFRHDNACIHEVFASVAERFPDNTALVFGQETIVYRELNRRANILARLLTERGVGCGSIVAIMFERGIDIVVAMLGILKAGGAYMPIDPAYPGKRKEFMLQDSAAGMLICQEPDPSFRPEKVICFADIPWSNADPGNPDIKCSPLQPAYIIYTSGTTGLPKGVLVTHYNLLSLFFKQSLFQLDENSVWSCFHSFCFDFSVWEIYGALFYGGRSVILSRETAMDPDLVAEVLLREKVNVFCQTPTAFYNFINAVQSRSGEGPRLDYVIFGGEALNLSKLKEWREKHPYTRLINMYGITETTIHCTYKSIEPEDIDSGISNIGHSLPNITIHILDEKLKELPIGAIGEICVGGEGVSLGYLNRVELTDKKFIRTEQGERLYRSGDIARRLPDGEIEYIGRKDNQVKIHGFRIELEEVENHILTTGLVKDVVVLARTYNGNDCLCAWFEAVSVIDGMQLRESLSHSLPHYMIPAYFMQLDRLPITSNGKKDKKSLPDIQASGHDAGERPGTEKELVLEEIWKEIFGVRHINVHDGFYESGGDSIRAIQLKSRLATRGFSVEIKDILRYNSLEAIAGAMQRMHTTIHQGKMEGEVGLTAIQARFLEENEAAMHHFNQSLLLRTDVSLDEQTVAGIFNTLLAHHDGLSVKVTATLDGYKAFVDGHATIPLEFHDLRHNPSPEKFIDEKCLEMQRSLHPGDGPAIRTALFRCEDETRLLITIHHFLIDGISWRVLIEDLRTLYSQARQGLPFALPLKTHSLQEWNKYVLGMADTVRDQQDYWRKVCRKEQMLFPSIKGRPVYARDFLLDSIRIGNKYGKCLDGAARQKYHTSTEELLVAALCKALQEKYGCRRLLMNIERHGRDLDDGRMDISRTIGWFTSVFPLWLEWRDAGDIRETILSVRESLRGVPGNGGGYGLLRYILPDTEDHRQELSYNPDVEFNYLGKLGAGDGDDHLSVLSYSPGEQMDGSHRHSAPLVVNAFLDEEGALRVELLFNTLCIQAQEGRHFATLYQNMIMEITDHCMGDGMAQLSNNDDIRDVFPLTPLQEGILFHHLVSKDPTVYFEQVSFIYNQQLQPEAIFESFRILSQRHPLLSASYIYEGTERPLQVILKDPRIKYTYKSISHMAPAALKDYLEQVKKMDKMQGFEPAEGPLIRLQLLKLAGQKYYFLWSFHHLIMDGWSLDIVCKELFAIYDNLVHGNPLSILPPVDYGKFIQWLGQADKEDAKRFWSSSLEGYDSEVRIPGRISAIPGESEFDTMTAVLPDEDTGKLRKLASLHRITVNGLIQIAWAQLLGRYNNTNDVVFGLIVSGRPPEIAGVDRMVGMFINAVPQRIDLRQTKDAIALAGDLQERSIRTVKYAHYPLARLQKETRSKGDLFDHIFNYINYPLSNRLGIGDEGQTGAAGISDIEVFERTHYDFTVSVVDYEGITLKFEYNRRRYETSIIQQLFDAFLSVIKQIGNNITGLAGIDMLGRQQTSLLLNGFNPAAQVFEKDKTLQELFQSQATAGPDRVAVVFGQETLDYSTLNRYANQLAHLLRKRYEISPGDMVAVMLDRSDRLITAVLGVLKSGAAYVPVDPDYPRERIDYILRDTACKVLIDEIWWTAFLHEKDGYGMEDPAVINRSTDLAYVIYTSGSTGDPKGVMVEHVSVVNLIVSQRSEFDITSDENILQFSSITFDASVEQIFLALTSGARLTMIDRQTLLDSGKLEALIDAAGITHVHTVPAMLRMLRPRKYPRLRRVIAGGDKCPKDLADAWAGYHTFYNEYGPTETTVTSIEWKHTVNATDLPFLPVGRPIANTTIYIMNEGLLSPIGGIGEIYIGGAGVARGYLNQDALTTEKFIADPFRKGERMYRTGDLARWRGDGTIEFMGRMDRQMKVRGFRIEAGEIENQVLKYGKIKEVIVTNMENEDRKGQEHLVAYIVPQEKDIDLSSLKAFLGKRLPAYMLPSFYVLLPKMPLTAVGKVDRAALPLPGKTATDGAVDHAPDDSTRQRLVKIWEEVLGVHQPGTTANFFDLGATSIDAMVAGGKMKKYFDIDDPVLKIFHYPTIDLLAAYIDGREEDGEGQLSGAFADLEDIRGRRKRRRNMNTQQDQNA